MPCLAVVARYRGPHLKRLDVIGGGLELLLEARCLRLHLLVLLLA